MPHGKVHCNHKKIQAVSHRPIDDNAYMVQLQIATTLISSRNLEKNSRCATGGRHHIGFASDCQYAREFKERTCQNSFVPDVAHLWSSPSQDMGPVETSSYNAPPGPNKTRADPPQNRQNFFLLQSLATRSGPTCLRGDSLAF